ncbi:MAG: FAD-binding oxidoreductase [Planctomycetes bacterium]|nr:FAD-binding oxidoreductase [Planctomycetota bacterium]
MSPEFVIVGQGLAGTALAWALLRRGRRVRVIDRGRSDSASRVAAGLITPVTGKRLARSWWWDELYPSAVAFYRAIEAETGAPFFHRRPALRLFATEEERDEYNRRESGVLRGLVRAADVGAGFAAPFGGFEMSDAARLDVPRYLDTSREYFRARGVFVAGDVSPHDPPPAEVVVFCRGFTTDSDPYFGRVRFNAAKGEMLTVRVPGLCETRVVHRGVWLAPLGDDRFRVGATYTWEPLDSRPTVAGRAEIEAKLRAFLKLPFEVLDHRAAVRPVIDAGFPALGRHPTHPRLAYFNGLGSKGSLLSPFFANQLAAHLCGAGAIDERVDVRKLL